jgi:hypothetical protein
MTELTRYGGFAEDLGGEHQYVKVSAKTVKGSTIC